jgi:hypothetical protein
MNGHSKKQIVKLKNKHKETRHYNKKKPKGPLKNKHKKTIQMVNKSQFNKPYQMSSLICHNMK